jgi:excinuclease ABC subunit B
MAHVIEAAQMPTLVMAPNKTLAAQLANEFREYFPDNAVEYFVSYYDYYQPEAYIPHTDTYIEKDSSINEEIDKLRHAATSALLSRKDVVVVASVSCIYNLGSPEEYLNRMIMLKKGQSYNLEAVLRKLIEIRYERNDINFVPGAFRVRGDVLEVFPAYDDTALHIEMFGDEIEKMVRLDPLTGEVLGEMDQVAIYPATHFLTSSERLGRALVSIKEELEERLAELEAEGKLLEAQRLKTRTNYDLEMLGEVGYCAGIENYSRHLSGKKPGEPPHTLLDYFPDNYMIIIDESHITVPQIHGMYEGDHSRKVTLAEHGFRLPSALDNRPLRWDEFEARIPRAIFVSATPGHWEVKVSQQVVEQIIRPTGLVDPEVIVRPTRGQIDDLIGEIRGRVARDERVLVTTLTKKMAEDLTDYLLEMGTRVRYLHSDIDTIERIEILRDLRLGEFDVLVGINLLREGLDLPEVSLVAILDADKEGFLRSERSLIQTIGRAARNVSGQVIMYCDEVTDSMRSAISETNRRRKLQNEYNDKHGIKPQTIRKAVSDIIQAAQAAEGRVIYKTRKKLHQEILKLPKEELRRLIQTLEEEMRSAAEELQFERAAKLRDEIHELRLELEAEGKKSLLER